MPVPSAAKQPDVPEDAEKKKQTASHGKRAVNPDSMSSVLLKKQRMDETDGPTLAGATAGDMLGRAWGPNVAVQPQNSANDVLSILMASQQMRRGAAMGNMTTAGALTEYALLAELSQQYAQQHAAARNAVANTYQLLAQLNPGLGQQPVPVLSLAMLQQLHGLQDPARYAHISALSQVAAGNPLSALLHSQAIHPSTTSFMVNHSLAQPERNDVASLLRQLQTRSPQSAQGPTAAPLAVAASASLAAALSAPSNAAPTRRLELPPCEEGSLEPYTNRASYPLGTDEDPNWLSEFHCFVRSELIEVFRASHADCKARNNSIAYQQIGIRCRFCAHLTPTARVGRSSAHPSSLSQIYQSFTMMLRDHFGNCEAMPASTQENFLALKDKPSQGATDSKRFWVYSAMKVGMVDTPEGIMVTEQSLAAGANAPPFGTTPGQQLADDAVKAVPLVLPRDRPLVSEFLFLLMSQTQLVRLTEAERIGSRRSLRVGLPGFGCRFCCERRRLGLSRMFPARRRTLPAKVNDLVDHLRRCTVCPDEIKEQLERTRHLMKKGFHSDQGGDREFFDRIWNRLGHGNQSE